jgi:hypothetical protein
MEPAVLEGAMAVLLEAGDANEVVQLHSSPVIDLTGPYDAAIVTGDLPTELQADVVIALPAAESGMGHVITAGADREVEVHSHRQVIDLLDEQFPRTGAARRAIAEG